MVKNNNVNSNALDNNNSIALPTCHNQSPLALKMRALRDVQNGNNRSFMRNRPESSYVTTSGKVTNGIKVFGTNILTSECPFSPTQNQSPASNDSEIISLDLELGKRRNRDTNSEENADCVNPKRCLQKQPNLPEQQTVCVPKLAPVSTASVITAPEKSVQQTMEHRFLLLQNVLKQCDEYDQRDYIQMLRCLSPAELSRHAVELEKRSMQLSVEEAREIQRTKAIDIFGTSSTDRLSGFQQNTLSKH